jgi:O-antigen/teichoic acid export membrane protein
MKISFKNLNLELIKHSGLMFTATIVGGLFNFLLQIAANNFLAENDFSFMYSLFTLSMIFGVLGMSVLTMISKEISAYRASNDQAKIAYLFVHTLIKISIGAAVVFVIFLPFAGKIASILNRPDASIAVIVTGFLMCLSVVVPVGYGALQGLEKFNQWSLSMIIFSFIRLATGVALIYMGYNVTGAIVASVIAYIVVFLIILYWLRDIIFGEEKSVQQNLIAYYKTSWWITIAFLFNYIICFVDILIVQHYFPGNDAALYSSASLLGRATFYLPWALAASMFPKIPKLIAEGKSSLQLLKTTLKYSFVLCLAAATCIFIFSSFIVGWLLKGSYGLQVPGLLKIFTFALIPYALITILIYYNIAAHRIKVLWVLFAGAIMHLLLLSNFRNSLSEIVYTLAVSGIIICAALFVFTFSQENRFRKQ